MPKTQKALSEPVRPLQPEAGAEDASRRLAKEEFAQFAYITAHNLKEPLRTIGISAGRLKAESGSTLEPRAQDAIGQILDGVHRMSDLVDDLFAYSTIDSLALEPTPVPMELVFNEVLFRLGEEMQRTRAVVTHNDLPVVLGDQLQLTQLLEHLIGNAIKFRSADDPRIHVLAERRGSQVLLRIQDNGIGVEDGYQEAIFKLFKRLHPREKYSGNGVGLAVCRGIVERHGGRIWVETHQGAGATFCLTLPLSKRSG